MNVLDLEALGAHGLKTLFPVKNALNTVNGEDSKMRDLLLESPRQLAPVRVLEIYQELVYFLKAVLSCLDGGNDLLHQGGLFLNVRVLVSHVLEDLHWVVLPV